MDDHLKKLLEDPDFAKGYNDESDRIAELRERGLSDDQIFALRAALLLIEGERIFGPVPKPH